MRATAASAAAVAAARTRLARVASAAAAAVALTMLRARPPRGPVALAAARPMRAKPMKMRSSTCSVVAVPVWAGRCS